MTMRLFLMWIIIMIMVMNVTAEFSVIFFTGCALQAMPPLLITELAEFGSLKSFFNKIVVDHELLDTTHEILLGFCADIACGMAYLSSIGVVHRGLPFNS